ncbi:MAG: thiamine phosphate synthase [Duncaniella sp.]|nr:thiamine phosphate synthase [Duncaniella sp.]
MLIFKTYPSERYSIPEEVQMALEGGCRWIELGMRDASDEEFRAVAAEVIPLCKENEAFLLFDGRVDLAIEMGIHGVNLAEGDMNPLEARELMGPEAIIGVPAHTASDVMRWQGRDVDYINLGPFGGGSDLDVAEYARIVAHARAAGLEQPIAAVGNITPANLAEVMSSGVNGVAVGRAIVDAPDPVACTAAILEALEAYRG